MVCAARWTMASKCPFFTTSRASGLLTSQQTKFASSGIFSSLPAPEVEPYQEAGIIWNDEFRQGNNLDRPAQLLRLKMHLGALGDQASFGTSFSCLNGPNIYIGHHFLAAGV